MQTGKTAKRGVSTTLRLIFLPYLSSRYEKFYNSSLNEPKHERTTSRTGMYAEFHQAIEKTKFIRMKTALITGITGQDGSYLADLLLSKGYHVHGIKRRSSSFNTDRIDHLYQDPHEKNVRFSLHYGDLTDATNLIRVIQEIQPDEIYNLAAQSHVKVSFETPEYTANADGLGALRILEAVRLLKLEKKTRIYQASTSEMFGKVQAIPQT